jgi:hypothetical protein
MKKLISTSVCVLAVAGVAFAQGNVNWGSVLPSAMTAVTNSTTYSPLFGGGSTGNGAVGSTTGSASLGTGYYYELLYSSYSGVQATQPSSFASLGSSWSDTGLSASNSITAGRLSVINPNAGAQVSWSPGTTNSIMLVGWSANLGSTWLSASNYLANWATLGSSVVGSTFFGESATGYITPLSTATSPGAAVFGTAATAQGLPIFSLNTPLYIVPVPEPGTIALATLGGLSMLALRRRKA